MGKNIPKRKPTENITKIITLNKNNKKQSYVKLNRKLNKLKKYEHNAHKFLKASGLNIPNITVRQQISILKAL